MAAVAPPTEPIESTDLVSPLPFKRPKLSASEWASRLWLPDRAKNYSGSSPTVDTYPAVPPLVSCVLPVHNAEPFLAETLRSLLAQTGFEHARAGALELSAVDDASTDGSWSILLAAAEQFADRGWRVVLGQNRSGEARGCGWACNAAAEQATGRYLCFTDADDVNAANRIELQLITAQRHEEEHGDDCTLVGANFDRTPAGSTARYTDWLNRLSNEELVMHRFVEVTLIKPTWFMARSRWAALCGFDERGRGTPEDMLFFYRHLEDGGRLIKAASHVPDERPPVLVTYRYHPSATSQGVLEQTLLVVRLHALQRQVLPRWAAFTIWNAGKQGRRVYAALSPSNQAKVVAFCDVDKRKISRGSYYRKGMPRAVPIVSFRVAQPPLLLCVKMDLTGGQFEANLASLGLQAGTDYLYFC